MRSIAEEELHERMDPTVEDGIGRKSKAGEESGADPDLFYR